MDGIRLIEAKYTPFGSKGGWAVPLNWVARHWSVPARHSDDYRYGPVAELIRRLIDAGLKQDIDFRVIYVDSGNDENRHVKRIIFDSDEAFIMAKMIAG